MRVLHLMLIINCGRVFIGIVHCVQSLSYCAKCMHVHIFSCFACKYICNMIPTKHFVNDATNAWLKTKCAYALFYSNYYYCWKFLLEFSVPRDGNISLICTHWHWSAHIHPTAFTPFRQCYSQQGLKYCKEMQTLTLQQCFHSVPQMKHM